jgi:hypothetical protein
MSNLKFIDTKDLKFQHDKNGVIAIWKNKKFVLGYLSILKESEDFSDIELSEYAQIVLDLQCVWRGFPKHKVTDQQIFTNSLIQNDYSPIYKYVQPEIFDNFIKKGKWQLGCINQYRAIENQKQRDQFEGYSFINMIINNHMVSAVCNSGFDYLIFSGTDRKNSEFHMNQFGERKISIPNVKSFAEALKKAVNAKRYFIHKVAYSSLKAYINRSCIWDSAISIENILVEPFFARLKDNLLYPSLFVKPEAFRDECEVRIVFEMDRDYNKPLKLDSIGLNDYMK